MTIEPKRQPLSLMVQNKLLELLMNGTFSVGEYLPGENALAEQFQVSRTTMRDAIGALVEKGFLERRHGKGVYIIDKSQNVAADSIRMLMLRNNYTVQELMETREVIESETAALAALRATDEQIDALQRSIEAMLRCGDNMLQYADYDLAFHVGLAQAAQNRLLLAVVTAIKPLLSHMIQSVVHTGGLVEETSQYHLKVLQAILQRDPELARVRMQEHLQASESMFMSSIDEGSVDKIVLSSTAE